MMEIVIKIPAEVKQAFDCAESNELKCGYYDHGGIIGEAIRNGTPLPANHGRIIDESQIRYIEVHTEQELYGNKIRYVKVTDAPTIIEADRE